MTLFADSSAHTREPRLEAHVLYTLTLKELRDAWRNRWFLLYTGAFCALALGMSWLSLAGAAGSGFAGLGRTAASLVHLVLLIVPLMGLTLGAGALAGERERGSLILLLAQPVVALEVVLGKFLGLAGGCPFLAVARLRRSRCWRSPAAVRESAETSSSASSASSGWQRSGRPGLRQPRAVHLRAGVA